MICLVDGCLRAARPDWTLCERHASDLLTAAFGMPTPRGAARPVDPPPTAGAPLPRQPEPPSTAPAA